MIYDLVVVGAGPAGSTAATTAAEAGLSVLLIDKAYFPRNKSCGGMLSAKSLLELGIDLPDDVVQQTISSVRVYGYNFDKTQWDEKRIIGKTVKRKYFDDFLVRRAINSGVKFIDGAKLIAIKNDKKTISIETTKERFAAKNAIGADGVFSSVAYLAGIRWRLPIWQMGFTLEVEVKVPVLEDDKRVAEFYFIPFFGGFGWAFPQKDGYNIGVGCAAWYKKRLIEFFKSFAQKVIQNKGYDIPVPKPRGCFLPAGGFPRKIAKGNIVLVGDAAGLVDPFSGEGIYYAMRSGHLAIKTLLNTQKTNHDWAKTYASICSNEFYHDFRLSLLVDILSGKKTQFQYEVLKDNPSMTRAIVTIMSQKHPYNTVIQENFLSMPARMIKTLSRKCIKDSKPINNKY